MDTAEPRPSETPTSDAAYLKVIDNARKVVAAAIVVCGVGFGVCVNRDDYLRHDLVVESGIWAWGCWVFGIGVLGCLTAALALFVEYLARPAAPARFGVRSLLIRSFLILIAFGAICLTMALAFGPGQAIASAIGTFLVLAAVREHHVARFALAVSAAVVLGLTLLGTQSAYQYARWHADEIVAAACELMDQCPRTDYYIHKRDPEIDILGQEIQPNDPRVPRVLRKLGARRIWVDEERVALYVGSNPFDFSTFPRPDVEFQIYRLPHPTTTSNPVWAFPGKGATKITDRLWTNVY